MSKAPAPAGAFRRAPLRKYRYICPKIRTGYEIRLHAADFSRRRDFRQAARPNQEKNAQRIPDAVRLPYEQSRRKPHLLCRQAVGGPDESEPGQRLQDRMQRGHGQGLPDRQPVGHRLQRHGLSELQAVLGTRLVRQGRIRDRQALSVPEHRHPAEPEIQEHSGRLLAGPGRQNRRLDPEDRRPDRRSGQRRRRQAFDAYSRDLRH